ncbi:MAG: hypothetical protein R3D67_07605 [Hyphomicrobiaceae bacterium]
MLTRDDLAFKFCVGRGVELGPGQRPTKVGPGSELVFVDKRSPEELKAYFNSPDIVAGKRLEEFEPGSFDFLIAHHVLEHSSNVLEELILWFSRIKPHGLVFLSVPDKRHTPDGTRLETPPGHFLLDYIAGVNDSSFESREHIYSFLWGWSEVGGLAGKSKQEASQMVANATRSPTNDLHWHVFDAATLKFVVATAAKLAGRTASMVYSDSGTTQLPEHRLIAILKENADTGEDINKLQTLRSEVGPLLNRLSLEGMEGQPLFSLTPEDQGKIFIADNSKLRWVREPEALADRGISGVPPPDRAWPYARSVYWARHRVRSLCPLA